MRMPIGPEEGRRATCELLQSLVAVRVTGVDLSTELIAHARGREDEAGVDSRVGDVAVPDQWWDGV